jgi:hypothetical protein
MSCLTPQNPSGPQMQGLSWSLLRSVPLQSFFVLLVLGSWFFPLKIFKPPRPSSLKPSSTQALGHQLLRASITDTLALDSPPRRPYFAVLSLSLTGTLQSPFRCYSGRSAGTFDCGERDACTRVELATRFVNFPYI